jgi:aminoglycoside 3-N-acetyltransferase
VLLDDVSVALELVARQVYFRSSRLQRWRTAHSRQSLREPQDATLDQLRQALALAGVVPGALVMAHTSVANMRIRPGSPAVDGPYGPARTASLLLRELTTAVGDQGTLVLPTHPLYREDPGYHARGDKSKVVLAYDPKRTPSSTGLTSELFRQLRTSQRSMHPLQTISCQGPRTQELLSDNLNSKRPLPHGIHSGYYRLCLAGGTVLSIGIPLIKCCTLIHVAEDVRDSEWPAKDFFRERRFRVRVGTDEQQWVVRERRPLFARSYCDGQLHRDLLREGILKEGYAGTVRVDYANARSIFEYLMRRNAGCTYPYYLPTLARLGG